MNPQPLTLFYDGLCPLCAREIAYYRKRLTGSAVEYVDITDPHFDAHRHGVDPAAVHKQMHIKVGDEVRTGVDAVIVLWDAMPGFRWLARLGRWPVVHGIMALGYRAFARLRPWLPRRRRNLCTTGTCQR